MLLTERKKILMIFSLFIGITFGFIHSRRIDTYSRRRAYQMYIVSVPKRLMSFLRDTPWNSPGFKMGGMESEKTFSQSLKESFFFQLSTILLYTNSSMTESFVSYKNSIKCIWTDVLKLIYNFKKRQLRERKVFTMYFPIASRSMGSKRSKYG